MVKYKKNTNYIREHQLRLAGLCWRSKHELTSDSLLWQPLHGKRSRGRPPKTYIVQLMKYIECTLDEIPTAMNERDGWKQRKRCALKGEIYNLT